MKAKRAVAAASTPTDQAEVLDILFTRYAKLAKANAAKLDALPLRCQSASVLALCGEAIKNGGDYPEDKMNRWIGFVQGVLASTGALDMDDEREFTRPLFQRMHGDSARSFPRVEKTS